MVNDPWAITTGPRGIMRDNLSGVRKIACIQEMKAWVCDLGRRKTSGQGGQAEGGRDEERD